MVHSVLSTDNSHVTNSTHYTLDTRTVIDRIQPLRNATCTCPWRMGSSHAASHQITLAWAQVLQPLAHKASASLRLGVLVAEQTHGAMHPDLPSSPPLTHRGAGTVSAVVQLERAPLSPAARRRHRPCACPRTRIASHVVRPKLARWPVVAWPCGSSSRN